MNDTMRVAVLYDVDDIRIEQRPIPELADGEVLVRTMASGICSGDVMSWYIRRKAPLVLGHEPAGVVTKTRGATKFSVGDRVFVHHHAPCLACRACERGEHVQCKTWRATKIDPGGISEYFRVAKTNLSDTLALPENVEFSDASLVEPLACVVKSLRRSGVRAGDRLYVIGLGVMGLLHVLAAGALGAEVFGADFLPERRDAAERNGANVFHPDDVRRALPDGADVVICGPGTPEAMRAAVEAAAPAGTVVMFTPFPPEVPVTIDSQRLYFGDLRIVASYSCGPDDTRAALRLIADGTVTARKVGADLIALDDVPRAYRDFAKARMIKPIVTFA
ncbi:MAG: alcohol dehydrogenase catalytic domain-containing protein [Candidatus Eremiobacteraeota bacterium]|nr:alcohol dehydrogenase catalytic domain-containing protein [Candidatus Eremiobacteraeota bacterium]